MYDATGGSARADGTLARMMAAAAYAVRQILDEQAASRQDRILGHRNEGDAVITSHQFRNRATVVDDLDRSTFRRVELFILVDAKAVIDGRGEILGAGGVANRALPRSVVLPTTRPPRMPPPARKSVLAGPQWSRPRWS